MPRPCPWSALLSVLALAAPARAALECPQPVVQLGEVRAGAPLSHRFVLVNRGAEPVEVRDVRPGCGCLAPRLEGRLLGPGEEGALVLEVNTLTQPTGPNNWRLVVLYRASGEDRELSLFLSARLVAEISVQPPVLAVYLTDGPGPAESGFRHRITLTDRRADPLRVTSVQCSSPHVRTWVGEARRVDAVGSARVIDVEVLRDCPEGRHEETLRLFTSDPAYPELKVPLTLVKLPRGRVRATPASLEWSAPAGAPLPAQTVLLAGDGEVAVERAEADDPAIECRWAAGPGPRVTLKVTLDGARVGPGGLRGAVHVHLSKPTPQEVVIPVRRTLPAAR